jgi:hypothetical protein
MITTSRHRIRQVLPHRFWGNLIFFFTDYFFSRRQPNMVFTTYWSYKPFIINQLITPPL